MADRKDKDSVLIEMGGRTYPIHELKFGPALEWQQAFKDQFGALGDIFGTIAQAKGGNAREVLDRIELPTLAGQIQRLQAIILDALPEAFTLMCSFSPAIQADRDHLLAEAYPSEIVEGFITLLKVALPAGKLIRIFNGAARGLTKPS